MLPPNSPYAITALGRPAASTASACAAATWLGSGVRSHLSSLARPGRPSVAPHLVAHAFPSREVSETWQPLAGTAHSRNVCANPGGVGHVWEMPPSRRATANWPSWYSTGVIESLQWVRGLQREKRKQRQDKLTCQAEGAKLLRVEDLRVSIEISP